MIRWRDDSTTQMNSIDYNRKGTGKRYFGPKWIGAYILPARGSEYRLHMTTIIDSSLTKQLSPSLHFVNDIHSVVWPMVS
jgi:hypothetical protein